MQSEEIDDNDQSKIISSGNDMTITITKNRQLSPNHHEADITEEFKSSSGDFKLETIDFETDLVKMIPNSPSTSESEVPDDIVEDDIKPELSITLSTKTSQHPDIEYLEPLRSNAHLMEHNSNESIRTWLQRISKMQNEIQKKLHTADTQSSLVTTGNKNGNQFNEFPVKKCHQPGVNLQQTANRVVNYQDLPYMGEMTLDNSKPRRGRKPKKADICHLIYKNYGTIFPGTPSSKNLQDFTHNKRENELQTSSVDGVAACHRSDVQNRIISSLLEKRLTQESKRQRESLLIGKGRRTVQQDEPLNLCVRDLDQLKIRLLKKDDIFIAQSAASGIKTEPHSDDEVEFVHETPSPQVKDPLAMPPVGQPFPGVLPEGFNPAFIHPDMIKTPPDGTNSNGYVYWSNGGVFIHPLALQQQLIYYQKLSGNNGNFSVQEVTAPPMIPIVPSTPEPSPMPKDTSATEVRKLVPPPKVRPIKVKDISENRLSSPDQKVKRSAPGAADKVPPTKRKRSAIFIPPIPPENQTNPSTEVSICKFKFTGGAKPSLQEKKMLSVDSGGNFRYYSGTGDKSMRGYEFFPRETLQQQVGNAQGSSTGAFLQASGEKMYPSATSPSSPASMVDFPGKVNEFMLTPSIPQTVPVVPDTTAATSTSAASSSLARHGPNAAAGKKRKSRKSLQREKLEQTFKEKGFLIQTQQLESAEGATYCKFRQLRKFTRYLFRSWKDYLPNGAGSAGAAEGQEIAAAVAAAAAAAAANGDHGEIEDVISEVDIDNLSKMSRSSNNSDITSPTPSLNV